MAGEPRMTPQHTEVRRAVTGTPAHDTPPSRTPPGQTSPGQTPASESGGTAPPPNPHEGRGVSIRRATQSDAADIARIHRLGYTVGAADVLSPDYLARLDLTELEAEWRTRLGLPHTGTRTLVAVAPGSPGGDRTRDGRRPDGAEITGSAVNGSMITGPMVNERMSSQPVIDQPMINQPMINERVVGFASYVRSYDPGTPYDGPNEFAELTLLYVDPDRWSRGIGGLLHDAVLTGMRAEGYHTARLWVLPGNARAIGFYRRRGWVDDHLRRVEPDHGFDLTYQRYRLSLSH